MLGVALLIAANGFAQFSPTAALADVAEHFGDPGTGESVAEQAGLPGTVLGGGLAAIRIASLAALPLALAADRWGRRRSVLAWVTGGLVLTVAAAGSPGFWWFVAAFALARPLLTASNTVGEVLAAEHTDKANRAKALALLAGAFGLGSGLVALLRAALGGPGFRVVVGLAVIPLAAVLLAQRWVTETSRFARLHPDDGRQGDDPPGPTGATELPTIPTLGALPRERRRHLVVLAALAFTTGLITAPANTLLFVYAENVLGTSSAFTAGLIVAVAPIGLVGLVVGRYFADRVGRRPTGAVALVALAAAGILAYSGSVAALAVGYLLGLGFGAAYGTPAFALSAELFPTSVRATVAGWLAVAGVVGATTGLLVVGIMADVFDGFAAALAIVGVPAALSAGLVLFLPETRGLELEESAPEPGGGA